MQMPQRQNHVSQLVLCLTLYAMSDALVANANYFNAWKDPKAQYGCLHDVAQ